MNENERLEWLAGEAKNNWLLEVPTKEFTAFWATASTQEQRQTAIDLLEKTKMLWSQYKYFVAHFGQEAISNPLLNHQIEYWQNLMKEFEENA